MNRNYRLVWNSSLGKLQVAPETSGSGGGSHAASGAGARQRPLAQAVLLALLGSSSLAMAAPMTCNLGGQSSFSGTCEGSAGVTGTTASFPGLPGMPGGTGAAGLSAGSGVSFTNSGSITGGTGGTGGTGATGMSGIVLGANGFIGGTGGAGGVGGAGVSGSGFTLRNSGSITGGAGGIGGSGGAGGAGAAGMPPVFPNPVGTPAGNQGPQGASGVQGAGGAGVVSTGNSTIYNSGTISGGMGLNGQANAITFTGGGNKLVLEDGYAFNGRVVATAAGDDVLALGGTVDSSFDMSGLYSNGQYRNFASFEKLNSSLWTLTDNAEGTFTNWSVKQGALRIDSTAWVWGDIAVDSGATLQLVHGSRLTGDISGNGTLQLGSGSDIHAVQIDGDYNQGSNGIFRTAATSNDSSTGYGRLIVTNASLSGKAVVDVTASNSLALGQTLSKVVSTTGTLTGNFTQVKDNSALFDIRSLATAGSQGYVDFEIIQAVVPGPGTDPSTDPGTEPGTDPGPDPVPVTVTVSSLVRAQGNNPALSAARVLDQIIASGSQDPGLQQVVTSLGKLETGEQVSNATSQTLPLLTGSSQAAFGSSMNGINTVVDGRLAQGRSSGEETLGERELWLKPFGSWTDQDERDGVAGFDIETHGLIIGGDAAVGEQTRLGLAFAYANSNIDGDSQVAPNSADVDFYQLMAYGSHDLAPATQLAFQVGYGQGRTEGQRSILFMGSEAESDYDSQVFSAGLGLNHGFQLGEATVLTPELRVDYTRIDDDSYTEHGAGVLSLEVDGHDSESLVLGLGSELEHALSERLKARLELGVGYDTINEQASLTSAYVGAPGLAFVTRGIDPSPWLGRVGTGLSYRISDTTELTASYDAEYREDFLNQTATLKARWAF